MLLSEKIMYPEDNKYDHRGDILNDDGTALFMTNNGPNSSIPDALKVNPLGSPPYCDSTYTNVKYPELKCQDATTANGIYQAARSRHTGGVNATMADGSVHFFPDIIGADVWKALSTMDGWSNGGANWEAAASSAIQ
jgi:prepilin-type processing-associated H-X9-DG protein